MANEKHLLLTAQGTYDDPVLKAETWQVGIRLALVWGPIDNVGTLPNNWDPVPVSINRTEAAWTITGNWAIAMGGGSFNPDDFLNDQAAPAFVTWLGQTLFCNRAQLVSLKLSPIGTNGRAVPAPPYSTGTPCLLTFTGTLPKGGGGTGMLPPQIACVMSQRSNQVGRHGRGRIFGPAISSTAIGNNGTITTTAVLTDAVAAQKALLEGLTYSAAAPLGPHTHAIITGKPWVNYGKINKVIVDSILDTQRRRRRSLVGTSAQDTVAP